MRVVRDSKHATTLALHCTYLYYTVLPRAKIYTALLYFVLQCTALYCPIQHPELIVHCTWVHCTVFHFPLCQSLLYPVPD